MAGGFGHEMDRLERAVAALLQWQAAGELSEAELLDRHPDLRDLLEPMLASEREADVEGQVLGDFLLVREIGRGGMGVVYEAVQRSLHRRVALKVLPAHLTLHPKAVTRFRREARTAARLEHEGIVQILDVGEEQDVHYFAMEYVDGLPLDLLLSRLGVEGDGPARGTDVTDHLVAELDRLRAQRSATNGSRTASGSGSQRWRRGYVMAMADIALQVADALAHAHATGVIHRDVKPSNILLREDGTAVLTDFGLAREAGLPSMTLTGEFAGTPYYVSPEQARGETDRLGPATDVFSLGATLYECLTLERAFPGRSTQEVLDRIQRRDPVPPHRLNPEVPKDLGAVVARCLEKDPRRRYAGGAELAEDLRAFAAFRPVRARRTTVWTRGLRWARREPWIAGSLAGVILALALGLVASLLFLGRVQQAQAAAEESLAGYRRLADLLRLQALEGRADDELWPPHPDRVPAMRAWLGEVEGVLARRALHEEQLAELRRGGSRQQGAAVPFAQQDELDRLRGRRDVLRDLLAEEESDPAAKAIARERLAVLEPRIERLQASRERHRGYRFADVEEQWLHDNLAALMRKFAEFTEPGGRLDDMRQRIERAGGLAAEPAYPVLPGGEIADWDYVARALADPEGPYRIPPLPPQVGLLPLGPDPGSGLQEFAHLLSGTPPRRGPDGRLVCGDDAGIVLVLVPGGRFFMGSRPPEQEGEAGPNVDPGARGNELPVHEVELEPFLIGKHEVTQRQWLALAADVPARYGAGTTPFGKGITWRNPVEQVSFVDAERVLSHSGLALPTEAQWEFAARAGTRTRNYLGDDPRRLAGHANLADLSNLDKGLRGGERRAIRWLDDGHVVHAPVGSFAPNPFGLHDVLGNVYEWTRDTHEFYTTAPRPGDGLRPPSHNATRVLRGGAWTSPESSTRVAKRDADTPVNASPDVGFRAARAVER